MSHQRSRGLPAYVWRTEVQTDSRGNKHEVPVRNTDPVKVWQIPERSAKAELPGQQGIEVIRIGVKVLPDVDLWSRVEVLGKTWDVVAPPGYHHGTRHTRHYSITLRKRP